MTTEQMIATMVLWGWEPWSHLGDKGVCTLVNVTDKWRIIVERTGNTRLAEPRQQKPVRAPRTWDSIPDHLVPVAFKEAERHHDKQ